MDLIIIFINSDEDPNTQIKQFSIIHLFILL